MTNHRMFEKFFKYLIVLLLMVADVFSQQHPNTEVDSLLNSGIDQILSQNYTLSKSTFELLDQQHSEIPLGKIYLVANEIARTVDYAEEFNEQYIDSLLNFAEEQTSNLLDSDDEDLWYNYYGALIQGYKAYYKAITNNIISAFSNGVNSLQKFQICLEIEPKFYEGYIAIGAYNYWKSKQTKSLSWLPFVSDKREEGIKYLEEAVNHSTYNYYLAANSLIWIYIDDDQSDKAIELSSKMLELFPESRFFRWGLARAYEDIDTNKAITTYSEILTSVETLDKRNYFNDIVLKHKIAMLYNRQGKNQIALDLCNEILDFKINSVKIENRLATRIERVKKLRQLLLSGK
ncbi:MAG: hypothetical protein GY936_17060 [Ignavibacteriae bacterium]|nr:hypothetical protein [Ignavibacteriota bacterium]